MKNFAVLGHKLEMLSSYSCNKLPCFSQSFKAQIRSIFRVLLFHANPFYVQLVYFVMLSLLGYLALIFTKPRTTRPKDADVFFTSVSATTVSSMSVVEMEVFSNTHLIILTILMLLGGEVFTSMLGLLFTKSKIIPKFHDHQTDSRIDVVNTKNHFPDSNADQIELGLATHSHLENEKPQIINHIDGMNNINNKYNSIRFLGYVVLGYLLVVHIGGSILVSLYFTLVPSARHVLEKKGIEIPTFAVFTTVSTFSNCGFVPTNENMIVFKNNSGLLLLLLPQLLLGNTLYPACLRFLIWVLEKITKRVEFSYMLKNYKDMGYSHMLSSLRSFLLAITVLGFIVVQVTLFCAMEWKSEAMDGLTAYQKFVASIFQTMNSRHAGESVIDLSVISPAILVLFVVMIAYGNVGFSTGYSCKRRLKHEGDCKDAWAGFSGRWSTQGKFILITVMFFGRLKSFSTKHGKAWKLS
ncbi:sodium transporter HKT1 isoform X2 [Prunus persica]|uniref:sodium transporter HKT1 isoform X2 n=1 Tax=Prunus persica TaxID=3760 RepID=UPI0009AB8852|nr:sodium transporter HKT1 isoform X2 [Prunus persica]